MRNVRTQTVGREFARVAALLEEKSQPAESRKTFGPYTVVSTTPEPISIQCGPGDCGNYLMAMVEAFIRHMKDGHSIDVMPTFAHCMHNVWHEWRLRPAGWICGDKKTSEIARELSKGMYWPPATPACTTAAVCFGEGTKWY